MGFRLVPKSVTLSDLERRNGRVVLCYFAEFGSFYVKWLKIHQHIVQVKCLAQRI